MVVKKNRSYLLMAQNNAWANQTFFETMSALSLKDFNSNQPGFFPSLCATMNHIYEVDLYYIDALLSQGIGLGVFDRKMEKNPKILAQNQAISDSKLINFCINLKTHSLDEKRSFVRNSSSVLESVEAILLHLFQHQIHHRGQAHVQLQTAGISPPQLDEFHLEFERASTAQKLFR